MGAGDVDLAQPGIVTLSVRIAARLEERPAPPSAQPRSAWHLEHARIPGTRDVMVDVVVNGQPVARKAVAANGELHEFSAGVTIERSSWVALRILPSGHTHPVFVRVAGKPVRASRRSAPWCLACIDAVWREKSPHIAAAEVKDAEAAYEQARVVYRRIALECEVA